MGISLEEIKAAFLTLPNKRTPTTKDWERLSSIWQEKLNLRIAKMEKLRDLLSGCIGCGCLSMSKCPIYNEDDKLSVEGSGAILLNRV
jgi:MerR family redox-sensitive transcriptional activator SoxR